MRYRDDPEIEQRYNCERWKKIRKLKRNLANGLCEKCLEKGIYHPRKNSSPFRTYNGQELYGR